MEYTLFSIDGLFTSGSVKWNVVFQPIGQVGNGTISTLKVSGISNMWYSLLKEMVLISVVID